MSYSALPGAEEEEPYDRQILLREELKEVEELLERIDKLEEIISTFDHSVHWLDWGTVSSTYSKQVHAKCGALVYDGEYWRSLVASKYDKNLASVTCPNCSLLPEYNLELLANTDLGDEK